MTPHDMNQGLHLDAHFNAIRQKFDGLAQELDEARNERDEYKRNCIVCFGHFLWIANLTPTLRHESSERTTGTSAKSPYC